MSHTLISLLAKIDLVSLYFRLLWYHSILRGWIDQKHAKTNEIWRQNSEIHSAFACSHWPPWLPSHMFGLSLFRPNRQSNISTSGEERFKYPVPRENKIIQMPYTRANKDNQIPTPCPAPPPTPPPPRRLYIDRCINPQPVTWSNVDSSQTKWSVVNQSKVKAVPDARATIRSVSTSFFLPKFICQTWPL